MTIITIGAFLVMVRSMNRSYAAQKVEDQRRRDAERVETRRRRDAERVETRRRREVERRAMSALFAQATVDQRTEGGQRQIRRDRLTDS